MKQVYSNDKNAPRMKKSEFMTTIMSRAMWRRFRKENPEYKNYTEPELLKLWSDIMKTLREEAILNPLGVKLPYYLGEIKFQFLPHKFEAINQKMSQEYGEKIPHLNISTKGKVGMIKWERKWAVKFNKILQFFAFDEARAFREEMPKLNLDSVRVSRITIGGHNPWRQYIKNEHKEKNT